MCRWFESNLSENNPCVRGGKASISVGHQAELREYTRLRGGSTVQFNWESRQVVKASVS